jgi:hypothetical protein
MNLQYIFTCMLIHTSIDFRITRLECRVMLLLPTSYYLKIGFGFGELVVLFCK